jgi:hypothetical protein
MKNEKVIVLSGYCYGGTNIAWNLLQSHPQICSPIGETGQIFHQSMFLRICHAIPNALLAPGLVRKMDRVFYDMKRANLTHEDNRFIADGVLYEPRQVEEAVLCFKSVNYDINLTEELLRVYPDLYFIALSRNGYSLCDGYLRRGYTATDFGRIYREIAAIMARYAKSISRFKLIKFEDVLTDPFGVAEELYRFVEVTPPKIDKLRLKVKKTIEKTGEHSVSFGSEKRKYWFERDTIAELLKGDIDNTQKERISSKDRSDFEEQGRFGLEYFGYDRMRQK